MSQWDWALVIGLNGAIILYGLYLSRGVRSSADWFLAGRSLPWWLVGISMYATAIDSSDLVADAGGTYLLGFSYFATNWVGAVLGWILAAFFICLPMYRAGLYTNAEYLETRYGTPVRVICAFVQVQYRTLVLGIIATTLFLTLSIVCGLSDAEAWTVVGLIAALAAIYTAFGGLRSVAMTDSLQFGVMTVAGLIIWFLVWGQVGGWEGMERRLNAHDPAVAARLLHAGHENVQNETVAGKSSRGNPAEARLGRKLRCGLENHSAPHSRLADGPGPGDHGDGLFHRQPHPGDEDVCRPQRMGPEDVRGCGQLCNPGDDLLQPVHGRDGAGPLP